MSESDRPPDSETETAGHEDDLAHDDLLSPPADTSTDASTDPAPTSEPSQPPPPAPRPRDPVRRLLPIGWALVVVIIVAAVVMVIALQRISSEVNRLSCVERAQANYASTAGAKSNSATASLARVGLQVALRKCGT